MLFTRSTRNVILTLHKGFTKGTAVIIQNLLTLYLNHSHRIWRLSPCKIPYLNTFLRSENMNYTLEKLSKMDFYAKTKTSVTMYNFSLNILLQVFRRCSLQKVLPAWKIPAASPLNHGKNITHPFLFLPLSFCEIIYENYIHLNYSHRNSSLGWQMGFKLNWWLF